MPHPSFRIFNTAIGQCGLAWSECGVVAVQFPERDAAAARARLLKRLPDAEGTPPPAEIEAVIRAIVALLEGGAEDMAGIALDLAGLPDFDRRVYAVARAIPPGETSTYGEVAARLGDASQARAVGQALGRNPFPIIVPCHRVLAAGGRTGGFSARGGVATKLQILSIERARTSAAPLLFDALPLAARP